MKAVRILCILSLLAPTSIYAQQQTALLTGQVKDSSGASVPGAKVTITDTERGIKSVVTTNEQGSYTFPQLPPADHYMLTVDRPGFRETVQRDVSLQVA